jgi:FRG domain
MAEDPSTSSGVRRRQRTRVVAVRTAASVVGLRFRSKHSVRVQLLEVMANIETVGQFLEYIEQNHAGAGDFWYRGQASDGWGLAPSVFRTTSRTQNEKVLLKRFIQEARRHSSEVPTDQWDWVFLAQHHFVPTRLLDWSESPLVGLYFAAQEHRDVESDPQTGRDGKLWVLQPTVMNSQLKHSFQGRDLPLFGIDKSLDAYNPFTPTDHALLPIAALAARSFPRISAQWGTFTVSPDGTFLNLDLQASKYLSSVTIPLAAKPTIRTQLAALGLDERTLYMDLFRLGQHVTSVFS